MVNIDTYNACVDFSIFDAKSRLMKKALPGAADGAIGRSDPDVVVTEALKDINIHLREGNRVGLIGHSDAGKPMLLRLLLDIYEPTHDAVDVRGRVAPVFDLGADMDLEISDLENVIIRDLFLRQMHKQMKSKLDGIAEFTELDDYLHMPLRAYSTGICVQLALGVVMSIEPEILFLSEGIGAVDAALMTEARTKLTELVDRSGLLVLASHSDGFSTQPCDTALWVDRGTVRQVGFVDEVVEAYKGKEVADRVRRALAQRRWQFRREFGRSCPSWPSGRLTGSW